jgi:putative heme transporter
VLIAGLTAAGGNRDQVTVAVLVYRALTWGLPIVVGVFTYLWWCRRSLLPPTPRMASTVDSPPPAGGNASRQGPVRS